MMKNSMLKQGMNPVMVEGLVEMGAAARSGELYKDYYQHRPVLGQTKLRDYAPVFAEAYQKSYYRPTVAHADAPDKIR